MKKLLVLSGIVLLAAACNTASQSAVGQAQPESRPAASAGKASQSSNSEADLLFSCQDLITESQIQSITKSPLVLFPKATQATFGADTGYCSYNNTSLSANNGNVGLVNLEIDNAPEKTGAGKDYQLQGTDVSGVGSKAAFTDDWTLHVVSTNGKYHFMSRIVASQTGMDEAKQILEAVANVIDASLNKY